jgi:hypothetical protein
MRLGAMLLALLTIVVSAVCCSSLRTTMMTTPSLPAKGNVNDIVLRLDMRNSYGSTRCSSRQAADILRNSSKEDGLLIITCDASGRGVSLDTSIFIFVKLNMLLLDSDTMTHENNDDSISHNAGRI